MMTISTPAVYVGTYHKYNSGSLYGKWLDLSDYNNADDFHRACAELHKDEIDPELIFQDWENIPDQYICESGIEHDYWVYLEAVESSHLDAEVFAAAAALEIPFDMVEELYQGKYDSNEDFAYQMADDMGLLPEGHHWPTSYIDWERAARDLMMDYGDSDGHYFRTSY